jgi:hypothetical protein
MRILAVADEPVLEDPRTIKGFGAHVVVSCGDLPFDYLEFLEDCTNVPLMYVPGNHDPDLRPGDQPDPIGVVGGLVHRGPPPGPAGGTPVDGRVVREAGLVVGGLGGSVRYRDGPNQHTQTAMRMRAAVLAARTLVRHPRRRLDILVTHAPPLGVGDEDDPAHRGFGAFHRLAAWLRPRFLIHGHIHPYGSPRQDRLLGRTLVVNAVGYRLLDMDVSTRPAAPEPADRP